MNTIISENLKKFRTQKNLTQEQAAQMLNVSAQSVSRWECGTTLPDVTLLPALAELYCVTVDDFFRKTSSAYENYAQRLAFVYQKTHDPEDYLRADLEFGKLRKAGTYSAEDRRIHGLIHHFMMTDCRKKALHLYDSVIGEGGGDETYWHTRTAKNNLRVLCGEAEECLAVQREAASQNPAEAEEWILLVRTCQYAKRYAEGHAFFREAVQKFPDSARLYAAGAAVCRALGQYEEALHLLSRADELDPSCRDTAFCRAHCYEDLGDYENAYKVRSAIVERFRREGHDVSADEEEARAQACLDKMKR